MVGSYDEYSCKTNWELPKSHSEMSQNLDDVYVVTTILEWVQCFSVYIEYYILASTYKPLLSLLEQLYINNIMEHFSYKGGCVIP